MNTQTTTAAPPPLSMNVKDLVPFTYYRNANYTRAFLLVDVRDGEKYGNVVVLIEWGKSRDEGIKVPIDKFLNNINNHALVQFTPVAEKQR